MSWPADSSDFEEICPLALEASGTGVWDRNVVTGEIRYSASWFKLLGYAAKPRSHKIEIAYGRVHPDDLDHVKATMQAHFDGETENYEVEHRLLCKNGAYKWVLSRGKVISRDTEGRALRMTGTTTDITRLRALQAKAHVKPPRPAPPARHRALRRPRKLYALEDAPAFPQRRSQSIPCFVRGTLILTPRGLVAVEALAPGDAVLTVREHGPSERPVIWAGQRAFGTVAAPLPEQLCPVLIRAGAFGPGVPERDLRLSPGHAVFAGKYLIEAQHLINGTTVLRDTTCRTVTYHHIALDAHDILLAENLPAESYLDCGGRASFTGSSAVSSTPILLRPDASAPIEAMGCAPLAPAGSAALRKIHALLDRQASLAGHAPAGPLGTRHS